LGSAPPQYFHHGLICNAHGEKLSKRQRAESITQLRESGVSPQEVIGQAAHAGGLVDAPAPLSVREAIALFDLP
jgi:glutamyl/glutaminyl-tRNA synthetase